VPPSEPATATAERLSAAIDLELQSLIEPGTEVALLSFPKFGNLGDAAIWLGEEAALARAGAQVRYRCDSRTYRRRLLRAAVGERGTVVLNGGGNLGDVYPVQQRVREGVLRDFPEARVIQLPQTIWYRDEARAREFGERCAAHAGFTLMVREALSRERARDLFGIEAVLAPDAAFALGPLEVPSDADQPVLWLMRGDRERIAAAAPTVAAAAGSVVDWPAKFGEDAGAAGRPLRAALALNRPLSRPIERGSRLSPLLSRLAAGTFGVIARRRLALALATLARGRVLVSDRLHGHILATLAGVPNVVLDSASAKSRAVYETWTEPCGTVRYADDVDQAREAAAELLSDARSAA